MGARQILKNAHTAVVSFSKLLATIQKQFKLVLAASTSEEHALRVLRIDFFKQAITRAELGLSLVQVDEMARVFDTQQAGSVSIGDYVRYLHYAHDRFNRDLEWKKDPPAS